MLAATGGACLITPFRGPEDQPAAAGPGVIDVARRRKVRSIALVAIPEGAAVFGFIVFFPLALQHTGTPRRSPGSAQRLSARA